jgi:hypothetical protein
MSETISDRNEEIRAFFVLGLLAVLASIRVQNSSITAHLGNQPLDLIPIIDVMILFMSFYALFMIFGYSKDMLGEDLANAFIGMARAFLIMNFTILLVWAALIGVAYYQNRLIWFFGILALPIVYLIYRKLKTLKIRSINLHSKKERRSIALTVAFLGIVISVLEISYYSEKEFVPLYFILGGVSMVVYLYLTDQIEAEKQKKGTDGK